MTRRPPDAITITSAAPAAPRAVPDRSYARVSLVSARGPTAPAQLAARVTAGTALQRRTISAGDRVADLPIRSGPTTLRVELDTDGGAPWLCAALPLPSLADAPTYVALIGGADPTAVRAAHLRADGGLELDDDLDHETLDVAILRIDVARDRELDDLDDLRAELGRTLRAGARDRGYAELQRMIATHPLLTGRDRQRLGGGLRDVRAAARTFAGAIDLGDRLWQQLTTSPALGAVPDPGPPVDGASADPAPIQWSTRVLDGERPVADLVLAPDHAYTLETAIGAGLADAIAEQALPAALFPADTDVLFTIACSQPVLRDQVTGALARRVEVTGRYLVATRACAPVAVGLHPDQPGALRLELGLHVGGTQRATMRVPLAVAAPLLDAPRPAVSLNPTAFTAPRAEVQVEFVADGDLVVTIDNRRFRPATLAASDAQLQQEARVLRNELVALAGLYRPAGGDRFAMADGPAALRTFARIGAALHALLFGRATGKAPPDLRALAEAIAQAPGGRLQAVSGAQWLPWALLYDGPHRGHPLDGPVDPSSFWGARFQVDRVYVGYGGGAAAPATPPRVRAFLNGDLDTELAAAAVQVVAHQRALFAPPPAETRAAFETYLRDAPPCDLLYFFCHARAAESLGKMLTYVPRAADDQAHLEIERGRPITVREMANLRDAPLPARPLVFLNACGSAAGDPAFPSPFVEQFLAQWDAVGLIGTDWDIPAAFADPFARAVLDRLLRQGQPLGAAVGATIGEALAAGNPYGLIYAVYAPPHLTLSAGAPS